MAHKCSIKLKSIDRCDRYLQSRFLPLQTRQHWSDDCTSACFRICDVNKKTCITTTSYYRWLHAGQLYTRRPKIWVPWTGLHRRSRSTGMETTQTGHNKNCVPYRALYWKFPLWPADRFPKITDLEDPWNQASNIRELLVYRCDGLTRNFYWRPHWFPHLPWRYCGIEVSSLYSKFGHFLQLWILILFLWTIMPEFTELAFSADILNLKLLRIRTHSYGNVITTTRL